MNEQIKQLEGKLPTAVGSERLSILNTLALEYHIYDPEKTEQLAREALALAEELQEQMQMANSYNNIGISFAVRNDNQTAQEYFQMALPICIKQGNKKGIATTYNSIGLVSTRQGDYVNAMLYLNKALEIYAQLNDKPSIAISSINIGIIYHDRGDYHQALIHYLKALSIWEELNNLPNMAVTYNNIGVTYENLKDDDQALLFYQKALEIRINANDLSGQAQTYSNMGNVCNQKEEYPSALAFYQQALLLYENLDDISGMAMCCINLGGALIHTGDLEKGYDYLIRALKCSREIGSKKLISHALNGLGQVNMDLGNYDLAEEFWQEALGIAVEIGVKRPEMEAYQGLSNLEEKRNNPGQALMYFKKYDEIKSDLLNESKAEDIAKLKNSYELEKAQKEAEIHRLKNVELVEKNILILRQKEEIEIEREKSDRLLLNILPTEVAHELKESGRAHPKRYDKVTILFTDFKGFTQIAARLSPEEIVTELDTCFAAFDEIIGRFHLEKIKTIGDAYMVAGGIPIPNDTNPMDVVSAALDMREWMAQWKQEKIDKNEPVWEIRIGIHTGPLVAGVVGKKKFAYDVWGDTVNMASRLESSGEPGKINISKATYELVKDHFQCDYRGKIYAKNKGDVEMYFVIGKN